jgi:hypothetical protein
LTGILPRLSVVDKGAEVWIADSQIGPAQEFAQRLNSVGGKAHLIELDVCSYPWFEWYLERLSPALSMRASMVVLKRIRELKSTAAPSTGGCCQAIA